jgi:copper resistance protein B
MKAHAKILDGRLVLAALLTAAGLIAAQPVRAATATDDAQAHGAHHADVPGATPASAAPSAPMPAPAQPAPPKSAPPYSATPAKPEAAMDHGDMKMQGGSAPPDARDPNAYSGGYTLESGPYSLGSPRQLRLADESLFGTLLVDRLEWGHSNDGGAGDYDAIGWFGTTYNRLVIKAEGEFARSKMQEARTEVLWGHAIAPYWDAQLGVRNDYHADGAGRNWLAFGVQGLAPYWFELDLTGYVGNDGRTALRASGEYELLLTQKWILQPRAELNLYGKSDVENGIGSGLSDLSVGLRLRYEITRQFAPYVGVAWAGKFGNTADLARSAGEPTSDTTWLVGVRFWF